MLVERPVCVCRRGVHLQPHPAGVHGRRVGRHGLSGSQCGDRGRIIALEQQFDAGPVVDDRRGQGAADVGRRPEPGLGQCDVRCCAGAVVARVVGRVDDRGPGSGKGRSQGGSYRIGLTGGFVERHEGIVDRQRRRVRAPVLVIRTGDADGQCDAADDRRHDRSDGRSRRGTIAAGVAKGDAWRQRQPPPGPRGQSEQGRRADDQADLGQRDAGEDDRCIGGRAQRAERDEYPRPGDHRAEQGHPLAGAHDAPAPGEGGHHVRTRRAASREHRRREGGEEADETECEQFDRTHVEVARELIDVAADGRDTDRGQADRREQAEHAAHDAQHDSLGQHHIAQILAAPADGRDQGELATLPTRAHGERRSGQQDDLEQRHAADERRRGGGLRVDRRVAVAELVGHLRSWRRIQVHRARQHDEAEPVEVQDLRPGHLIRRIDQPGDIGRVLVRRSRIGHCRRQGVGRRRVPIARVSHDAHEAEAAIRVDDVDLVADAQARVVGQRSGERDLVGRVRGAPTDLVHQALGHGVRVVQTVEFRELAAGLRRDRAEGVPPFDDATARRERRHNGRGGRHRRWRVRRGLGGVTPVWPLRALLDRTAGPSHRCVGRP